MAIDPRFKVLTTEEVIKILKSFMARKDRRIINQLHIHHTWKPNYSNFKGNNHLQMQQGMRDYHVNNNKWSDIAQHLTLFPDGKWVNGRDLNIIPASITNWNTGAICIEMVGDFDIDKDVMTKEQKDSIYEITELLLSEYKLIGRFHRDSPTAGKTCPGTGIDKELFFKEALNFSNNRKLEEAAKQLEELQNNIRIVFKDMLIDGKEHWANKYVNLLYDNNIVSGRIQKDGSVAFKPDEAITRAETATIVARTLEKVFDELEKIKEALKNAGINI